MNRNIPALSAKATLCRVVQISAKYYHVSSPSGRIYTVRPDYQECNCEWNQYRTGGCAHLLAVSMYQEKAKGRKAYSYSGKDAALRQKRGTNNTRSLGTNLWIASRNQGAQ